MKTGILMGGAGFIDSHLADELLETLRVLRLTDHVYRVNRRRARAKGRVARAAQLVNVLDGHFENKALA
jgi:nucleoside-diphosphate-sugar epimerase